MSLTKHLKDQQSSIGRFIRDRFSNTLAITQAANVQLRSVSTLLPLTQAGYPWPLIGMAVDYRLRYFFPATPARGLVAYHAVWEFETAIARAIADGLITPDEAAELFCAERDWADPFFDHVDEVVTRIQPVGRLIPPADNAELARYCVVLAWFEIVFREKHIPRELFAPAVCTDAMELLARVNNAWVNDICQISQRFYERCAHLLARPAVLNPTFVGSPLVGGADADLIVDGCLIDIKTTKNSRIEPEWIHQLVGYLLLDYDDRRAIRTVGIYMARQGELMTWPVEELLPTLTGDPTATLSTLRAELYTAVAKDRNEKNRVERESKRINAIKEWLQDAQRRGKPLTVRTARMRLRKLADERKPLSERTVQALISRAEAELVN